MVKIIFNITEIIKIMYLLLPAYFANMAPVFFNKVNFLVYPVDFEKKINGKRIFGQNKTFRGVFFGIVIAIIVAFIQKVLNFESLNLINYDYFIIIGFILGAGALFGDLIESFIKRMLNIAPGKSFFPFDQIDYVLVALIFMARFYSLPFWSSVFVIIITIPLHVLINLIGHKLKLRKDRL